MRDNVLVRTFWIAVGVLMLGGCTSSTARSEATRSPNTQTTDNAPVDQSDPLTTALSVDTSSSAGQTPATAAPTTSTMVSALTTVVLSTETTIPPNPPTTLGTASTLPAFSPPSEDNLIADGDANCEYLYSLIASMNLGSNFPTSAKRIGRDDGSGESVGCEMYFDNVRDYVPIRDENFLVAWSNVPLPHRQPTNDPDESAHVLSSGATALVDPTGDDGEDYDDVRVVSIGQPDGSIAFVMGFKGTSLESTIAVANEFDRAIRAAP